VRRSSRFEGKTRWLHRVRLYPTSRQERVLAEILDVTRELYNALLQQRRDAWTTRRQNVSGTRQYAEITDLRKSDPRFAGVYREVEDAVLHRLDLAMAAFFHRLRDGKKPGYPDSSHERAGIRSNSSTATGRCCSTKRRVEFRSPGPVRSELGKGGRYPKTEAAPLSFAAAATGTPYSRRIARPSPLSRLGGRLASIAASARSSRPATESWSTIRGTRNAGALESRATPGRLTRSPVRMQQDTLRIVAIRSA
jgi:hypothetical protein